MHIQTHILCGWCVANCLPATPRQRLFAMLAASLADIDGLGIIFAEQYYVKYHHVVAHGLFFGLLLAGLLAWFSPPRIGSIGLYLALVHLHLLMDYFGSGRGWTITYLWPFSLQEWRTQYAWSFNSWQNQAVFVALLLWTVLIAIYAKRTPLEAIMPKLDSQLVVLGRKRQT